MEENKSNFFQDLISGTSLASEKWKRKQEYFYKSIPINQLMEYEKNGWVLQKKGKLNARIKKIKDNDAKFEDEIWAILADMGFNYMNSGRFFKLPYSDDDKLNQQIDILAMDNETILVIECKAAESLTKNHSFKETIEAIGGKKIGILSKIHKIFPEIKYRVKFIFVTKNYILTKPDLDRLKNFGIAYFQEEEIEYYRELTEHLGFAAKYQLLGNLFQGDKIPGINNKVPAIKSKLGPYTIYYFSIEPERLLKIGYVLHRTKANIELMPTYQRLIKKKRLKNIQSFIEMGGFFANSITINIESESPLEFDLADTQCKESACRVGILHLPQQYRSAYIIDGQHRVYAYANLKNKDSSLIPVVAFEHMGRSKQVELFMDINENQKAVSKSLRNTLNAELLWNSDNLAEAFKAIKLKVAQDLGEDKNSPLFERILIGEDKKTANRCITIDTIYSALDKGNFLGSAGKNTIKKFGTFYDGNVESTFLRLKEYLILCLEYFRTHFEADWELGESENGYLTVNSTIYVLILLISNICDHLNNENETNLRTETIENLVNDTSKYLDPVIIYFKNLPIDEKIQLRRSYGLGGRSHYWRKIQQIINATHSEFKPEGLDQYILDSMKRFNTKSFEMIRDIETYIKEDVKKALIEEYGTNWWKKGIPLDVYEAAETLAIKKNRQIDDPSKEESPFDQLVFIDYRKIMLQKPNWNKLFQKKYSYPGTKGDQNDKTVWLAKINAIRNQNFHEYSVKEEEYKFLTEVHEWINSLVEV